MSISLTENEESLVILPSGINSMSGSCASVLLGLKLKVIQELDSSSDFAKVNFVGKCVAVSFEDKGIIVYLMPDGGFAIRRAPLVFTCQIP
jgi:hypothetical protein